MASNSLENYLGGAAATLVLAVWPATTITTRNNFSSKILQIQGSQSEEALQQLILHNKERIKFGDFMTIIDQNTQGWQKYMATIMREADKLSNANRLSL